LPAASRQVTHRYRDPLDEIWVGAARRIGFSITRTRDAYAATDGRGAIHIGEPELLDADDCVAQIVFHELCHALVEGEAAWRLPDWGLDNTGPRDEAREHACLRVQAELAARHGLREVLAATTDHRPFYDTIPGGAAEDDPLARAGLSRAARAPFAPHLEEALAATARVLAEAARWAPDGALAALTAPRHPVGFAAGSQPGETCGSCVWRARDRCRMAGGARVDAAWAACARWRGGLDCGRCGACCREAFHSVSFGKRDPFARRHPGLVVVRERYLEVRRAGDRCAALAEDGRGRFACAVYDDRPRPCREFPAGGESCLLARRRVGLEAAA
jgi:hypothetical protein